MFLKTEHCKTRVHCRACRNNDAFYKSLQKTFGEIVCPIGLPRPCPDSRLPKEAQTAREQVIPCQHAKDTGEKVHPSRPCAGNWIECGNAEVGLPKVRAKDCGKGRCKFYAPADR